MSVPSYIINWEEFAMELSKGITIDSVNIDNSGIENLLEIHFPEVVDLLEKIANELIGIRSKYNGYDQKIQGFNSSIDGEIKTFEFRADRNIFITGVSFSHNHKEGIGDYFNLSIENETAELVFNQVSFKDALQHKHFNKFFPVPAGTAVRIEHFNESGVKKHVWYDLEYLEESQGISE